ncbi:MAG: prolipoprotein diacylglyceryl transferase [Gammaproteobacteria bacterium]
MISYPHFNPIALQIGFLKIHWYGLMYVLAFVLAWCLALYRAKRSREEWNKKQIEDLLFYCALGVVIGGRLGYVFFYDFSGFLIDQWIVFKIWQGGMSFHGGLLGVALALWLFANKYKKSYFDVTDFVVPLVPLGLGAGRIGNFINGELWGRVTNVPWGMVFPNAGPLPRHPSQLYEFLFEGIILFIILWVYSSKSTPKMAVSALFLLCYGTFRFILEFFRQPDPQWGYIAWNWLTMGQLLSLPMILIGIIWMGVAYHQVNKVKGSIK